jgi:hypothetical protein
MNASANRVFCERLWAPCPPHPIADSLFAYSWHVPNLQPRLEIEGWRVYHSTDVSLDS